MKKIILLSALLMLGAVAMNAANPEINVGGTEVKSSNYSRIEGNDIKQGYGVYNESTNTLTLYNIKITRTGTSNYGIHNRKCDDLKIVFVGNATIETEAPGLKLERGTTVTVQSGTIDITSKKAYTVDMGSNTYYFNGSGTINFESTTSDSKDCLHGNGTSNTKVYFQGAKVSAYSVKQYALNNFSAYFNAGADLTIYPNNSKASVNNVPMSFTTSGGKKPAVLSPYGAYYSSNSIYTSSGSQVTSDDIYISDNYVAILNSSFFPDANFRNALYNLYPKGYINQSDVNSRTELNVASRSISSLTGLGIFTALKTLDCSSNQLTSLPTLPGTLQSLKIGANKFTSLSLTYLSSLKTLDVGNNKSLTTLTCSYNALTSLDASGCSALTSLDCRNNALTYINMANCTALTSVNCSNNQLTSVPGLPYALQYLYIGGNNFTSMTIDGHSALKLLDVSNNYYLDHLYCNNNGLTSLNVEGCNALYYIDCHDNQFTSPLFSLPSGIQKLYISGNKFTSLTINAKFKLNTLDANNCTSLTSLDCSNNALTSLNLEGCTQLKTLDCKNNQLTEDYSNFDIMDCNNLTLLDCSNNKFADQFVLELSSLKTLYCKNNTLLTELDVSGWGDEVLNLETLDVSGCTALEFLCCMNNKLTSLNISGCNSLAELICDNNQLTSLNNIPTSIKNLYCEDNKLTSIDVRNYKNLDYLYVSRNALTSAYVSGCSALKKLEFDNNQLTTLDLTGCDQLYFLTIKFNKIKGDKMTALISSLPTITASDYTGTFIAISEHPGYPNSENNEITPQQVDAARAKRWMPLKWVGDSEWVEIPGSNDGVLGDLDGNGLVDVEDVNAAINIILKMKTVADYPGNGDMDGNGIIDVEDVNAMINIILKL